ncbi:hypothetical protein LUZ60_007426 [Juncus effusus]|nr:hypothetical protein LUZ60_007426 [Juncus effusus]
MSNKTRQPQKGASFHGRTVVADRHTIRRPKTEPDLLLNRRDMLSPERPIRHRSGLALTDGGSSGTTVDKSVIKTPAKVLVNVTVQKCMWPMQIMALAEWTVTDLVSAVLKQYVKEARKPRLITTEISAYGLHYSQFSLECLDSKEKLVALGSRNFFLCPKICPASQNGVSSSNSCSDEAEKAPQIGIPWHRFMEFLL